ncbi:hypothetical protein, partial [Thermococcus sp.]|uniref:hypothetical protein n=1 Tax=Thermococcus sp. TaxID=35749 RepID=UPI0026331162
ERRKPKSEREETIQTTIMLPQLVRMVIGDIKEKYPDLNWQELTRILIEHGFSIIEHRYGKVIREIGELKKELMYPEIRRIRNFLMDTKVNVDGIEKPARKGISIRKGLHSGINTVAEKLGIEFSSMIRLCIYHSLTTSSELPSEVLNESEQQIEKFKRDLLEIRSVLMGFKRDEDIWREKKDEWLKELEEES